MKNSIFSLLLLLSISLQAQQLGVSIKDLRIIGGQWEGQLTYTDYSDDKSTSTLNCSMNIYWKGKKAKITTGFVEPNGKVIDDISFLKLIKNKRGIKLAGVKYQIDSFKKGQGKLKLVMSCKGKDNLKPATIRQTISFDQKKLILLKEVRYGGSADFFVRNRYDLLKN